MPAAWPCRSRRARSPRSTAAAATTSPTASSAPRSAASPGALYGNDRLQFPQIRTGAKGKGQFRQASWNEALGVIATRIDEVRTRSGAEAILPFCYGGSNGLLTQEAVDARFFRRLGASRLARTVCAAPTGAAALGLYGKMPGVAYEDYPAARLIVLWGVNPSASGIHLVPFVREAQRKGATLVVVDPRRTALAKQADLHIALRPGTDLPVALALHRVLFENGLADETFLARSRDRRRRAARRRRAVDDRPRRRRRRPRAGDARAVRPPLRHGVAGADPLWLGPRAQPQRRPRGDGRARRCPAVAGKFGVRGGGYSMSNSGAWQLNNRDWIGADAPATRVVNMNVLGEALQTLRRSDDRGAVRLQRNPVATIPDQNAVIQRPRARGSVHRRVRAGPHRHRALRRRRAAGHHLPRALRPESQLRRHACCSVKPVIEPVGESRPNVDVFSELEVRLGLSDGPTEDETEALFRVARRCPATSARSSSPTAWPRRPAATTRSSSSTYSRAPPTARSICSRPTCRRWRPAVSTATRRSRHRRLPAGADLAGQREDDQLDARRAADAPRRAAHEYRGCRRARRRDGDAVRVFNALGEVHCLAEVTDAIRAGHGQPAQGTVAAQHVQQSTATALAPAR